MNALIFKCGDRHARPRSCGGSTWRRLHTGAHTELRFDRKNQLKSTENVALQFRENATPHQAKSMTYPTSGRANCREGSDDTWSRRFLRSRSVRKSAPRLITNLDHNAGAMQRGVATNTNSTERSQFPQCFECRLRRRQTGARSLTSRD
jgi:hypothetical protein